MKITIDTNKITLDQCEIELDVEISDIEVRGNAIASDDETYDKQVEDKIIQDVESGNVWAWCDVGVIVKYKGFEGRDYLGACSYKDESDFKSDGYFEDMKFQALNDLIKNIEDNFKQ